MAYPEDYDELEGLDLGECATFSHILVDGIVETADEVELGSTYCVFANYGAGEPLVTIVDPVSDDVMASNIEGTFLDNALIWKFCVDIPAKGEAGENDTVWEEKHVILKLHSDESEITFKKHVEVILTGCSTAEMCSTMDSVVVALDKIQETDVDQSKTLKTLSNGWKVIN